MDSECWDSWDYGEFRVILAVFQCCLAFLMIANCLSTKSMFLLEPLILF